MKRVTRSVVLILGSVLGFSLSASADISAGVAVVDITPPLGGQIVGYGSPSPTDGINHPVTARVLVLESDGLSLAIVIWDLCVATSPW